MTQYGAAGRICLFLNWFCAGRLGSGMLERTYLRKQFACFRHCDHAAIDRYKIGGGFDHRDVLSVSETDVCVCGQRVTQCLRSDTGLHTTHTVGNLLRYCTGFNTPGPFLGLLA